MKKGALKTQKILNILVYYYPTKYRLGQIHLQGETRENKSVPASLQLKILPASPFAGTALVTFAPLLAP